MSYQMKYQPSLDRLWRYENIPPKMCGDPDPPSRENDLLSREWSSWAQRERAVYDAMMRLKRERERA